jgi:hypothetical protein
LIWQTGIAIGRPMACRIHAISHSPCQGDKSRFSKYRQQLDMTAALDKPKYEPFNPTRYAGLHA